MSDFLRLLLVMLGSIPSVVWAALAGAAVGAIGTAVGSAVTGHYGMKREQEATAARLTEWTRDRAYEALADIDATHRMASLDHARLANKAKNEVSGLRQDEMGEHFELSIKFTNAAARAILLTPNLEVRKLIEQLEDETHDVAELIHQYRYTDNPARYDFLKRVADDSNKAIATRKALQELVRGDVLALAKEASQPEDAKKRWWQRNRKDSPSPAPSASVDREGESREGQ